MSRGDAVQDRPSMQDQMDKFQSFATTDGEVSDGKQTADEAKVLAEREEAANNAKAAKAANETKRAPIPGEKTAEKDDKAAAEKKELADTDTITVAEAKKMAQGRVRQLAREKNAAEAKLADASARYSTLEARLAALESGKPLTSGKGAGTQDADAAPDPEKYDLGELDKRYIRDLARFETRQELKQVAESTKVAQGKTEQERRTAEFETKYAALQDAGAAKYDDFDDVVVEGAKNNEWPLPPTLVPLILDSEVGHDVAYFLATHAKEAKAIAELAPAKQAAAFGRLELKFTSTSDETETEPAPKAPAKAVKTTGAPTPVTRTRGAGGNKEASGATSDFAEFERLAMGRG